MKRSFVIRGLAILLIAFTLIITAVGCGKTNSGASGENGSPVDLSALNAELALAPSGQGDYTAESYAAYTAALAEARAIAADPAATQTAVDTATAALTAARLALTVRENPPTGSDSGYIPDDNVDTDW